MICVPTTPSISEKFVRASTSINFELGASSVIDNIDNSVAAAIGALDDPADQAAVRKVAESSTCSQLLRYYPPRPDEVVDPNAFSYDDPEDASPVDALDVSSAYELHTDCHDYVGGVMQEPADRSISALLYLSTPLSGGHTSFPVSPQATPTAATGLRVKSLTDWFCVVRW